MLPPLTDRREPTLAQLEALISALEFDVQCLRVRYDANEKSIAVLRARIAELQEQIKCDQITAPPVTRS